MSRVQQYEMAVRALWATATVEGETALQQDAERLWEAMTPEERAEVRARMEPT